MHKSMFSLSLLALSLVACQSYAFQRQSPGQSLANARQIRSLNTPMSAAALAETRSKVDQVIEAAMAEQQLVGLAVGLVKDGQMIYLKGYGMADRERGIPVTEASSFRWASLSKSVTAVLSMQLVEQGKLNLDTPIQTYWPNYRNAQGWSVTQRQLLSHLGGVGSYDDVPGWQAGVEAYHQRPLSPAVQGADMVQASADVFASAPLLHKPGQAYRYSTFGSMLAGAIVAKAGQSPFVSQFEQRIKQPLGLTTLQPDYAPLAIPQRVRGYYRAEGQAQPLQRQDDDVAWKLAGGGFTSTIGDLTRYMQALINQELLQGSSYQDMWTPQLTSEGKPTGYALSFGVSGRGERLKVGHFGAQEQTRTVMSFLPHQKLGLAVMCNSEWAELGPIRDALYRVLQN